MAPSFFVLASYSIISSSVNCGYVAANWSVRCTAEFMNIGRNVIVALKSGPVETGPPILVATALPCLTSHLYILQNIVDQHNSFS